MAGAKNANYCYDNNGNLTQGDSRTVAWTAFNMPSLIQQNARQVAIAYGPDRARFKRVDLNETGASTTYYVAGGSHEVVESGTTVTHKTYIGGAAVVIETTSAPASTETVYLLHDHLGSTDVITAADGTVQTRYSFDAWGRRRDVTWAAFFPAVPASLWQTAKTTRGFTGHEELDEVGLVHMNGRVYDPELGRFLSADPVVQDATDLQAFNHYAYVRNNPLSLLDPSGFSWIGDVFKSIGNFFSSVFRTVANAIKAILKNSIVRAVMQIAACAFGGPIGCVAAAGGLTLASGGSLTQAMEAMAFTMLSVGTWSAVGSMLQGVGAVMQSGFDMVRVLVHGVVQGALSMAQGGSFLNGFAIGAAGEAADVGMKEAGLNSVAGEEGRYERAMIAGAVGGTASVLTGGNFANGAVSAAFAHLFNDEAHSQQQVAGATLVGGGLLVATDLAVFEGAGTAALGGFIVSNPIGWVVGGVIVVGGVLIYDYIASTDNIAYSKPPSDAYDQDGAKAPGKPGEDEGFKDPKSGEDWVKNPNGKGNGWADADGNVWVPTGPGPAAHGGPHWDVQNPDGNYENVYPGGKRR